MSKCGGCRHKQQLFKENGPDAGTGPPAGSDGGKDKMSSQTLREARIYEEVAEKAIAAA